MRLFFIITPIIAGSIASARMFVKDSSYDVLTSVAAMVAGLLPLILKGMDLDGKIKSVTESASQYTILRDRFRQASLIGATGEPDALKTEFDALMHKLDEVRKVCPAIPERHFEAAKKKIKDGHYKFDSVPE
jgi:hypothetical protein